VESTEILRSLPDKQSRNSLDGLDVAPYNRDMRKALPWILLTVALAGLAVALDADPSRLLWRDFITDEGWWTAEARDRVLFGDWVTDDYNQGLAVPAASWAWRLGFELLGVTLLAARMPSLVAALLVLLLLGRMSWRGRTGSEVLGVLLLASSLPFALHARVALPELPSLLGVVAAWWLLGGKRRGATLLAGLAFGLALSAKASAVVALPPLLWIARGADQPAWRLPAGGGRVERVSLLARWSRTVNFAFASLLCWGLARLPFGLSYPDQLSALEGLHRGENLPLNPVDLLANLAYFPFPAPFLYQTAPLLALAGIGAWALGLQWRRRDLTGQALAFLLLGGLTQALLLNPADRRFIVFLPALAILALRGWRALADGEKLPSLQFRHLNLGAMLAAAFAMAAVLPGRLALWYGRWHNLTGDPLDDTRLRALAAGLFILALAGGLIWLARRPRHLSSTLAGGLLLGWLTVCLEHFDFLILAGSMQLAGRYDASRLWLETGGVWSLPWGLTTLLLIWLALARIGWLPGGFLERGRRLLPWLVPVLSLALFVPTWLTPSHSLRDAAATLAQPPAQLLIGAEAPSLGLGSELPCVVLRDSFNLDRLDGPPPGTRRLLLVEDSGQRITSWPRGAESLELCPQADGQPRFRFAVWDLQ
jgi:hypothetical protein